MSEVGDVAIRISDVERDEAVSTLGPHLSTRRLELDEAAVLTIEKPTSDT